MAVNFFDQFDEATGALDEQGNFFDQFDVSVEEQPPAPSVAPAPVSQVVPLKTYSNEGLVSANQERLGERLAVKNVLGVAGLAEAAARQNPTALTLITELAEGAENPWISSPGWTLINHLASGVVKETVDVVDMLTEGDVREDIIDASKIIREEAAVILGDPNIQYQGNAGAKFGFEVAEAVVNMGGALAVGYVTKNPSMALGVIGAQVGGETYQRYMTETGGNHDAAMMAAKFHVVAEVLPETIPVFAALRKTKVGEGVRRMLETTIGEGVQEMLTSILTQAYDNKQLENMSLKEAILGIDWGDVVYEGAIGTFVGATIGAPGALGDYMEGRRQGEGPPPDSTLGQELTPDFKTRTIEENATVISDLIEVMPDIPETPDTVVSGEEYPMDLVDEDLQEADAEVQAWAEEVARKQGLPPQKPLALPEPVERRSEANQDLAWAPADERRVSQDIGPEVRAKPKQPRTTLPGDEAAEPVSSPALDEIEAKLAKIPKDLTEPDQIDEVHKLLMEKRNVTDQLEHGLTPKQTVQERTRLIKELHAQKKTPRKYDTITTLREKVGGEGTTQAESQPSPEELEAMGKEIESAPSKAQIAADNYRKAHPQYENIPISMENKPGDKRGGRKQFSFYGSFTGTKGADGDAVDLFLDKDNDPEADTPVFIINQYIDGKFDEHKIMLGFDDLEQAEDAYLANYDEDWQGLESTHQVSIDELKDWLKGDTTVEYAPSTTKPVVSGEIPVDDTQGEDLIFGKTWKEIQDMQQKQYKPETVSGEAVLPTATENDIAQLKDIGLDGLKKKEFSGVIDRLKNSGIVPKEKVTAKKVTKPGGKTPVGDTDLVVGNIVRLEDGDVGKILTFTYVKPYAVVKLLPDGPIREYPNASLTHLPDGEPERAQIVAGGKAVKIFIPSTDTEIKAKLAVVPGKSLIASHDKDGAVNPEYPEQLQPRDRKKGASRIQIGKMANNLKPELLADSGSVDSGSPIIGPDGIVESGNARTLAILKAYEKNKAKKYLAYLRKNAESYGLKKADINAMEQPVLVRVRQGKMTMAERAEFARAANVSGTAPMSPVETAKADAKRITDDDMKVFAPGLDGNILAHSNNIFLEKFMSHLGTLTAGGMTTADGRWNKQFGDRVQSAVFYKAYESEPLLALMAEEADPGIKNILTALSQSAPEFARARSIGDLGDLDIANDIVSAIDMVKRSQAQGASVDQLINQTDMFGDVDPAIGRIALFIEANIGSARKLDVGFSRMAQGLETTMKSQSQAGLFDEQPPVTKTDLVDAAGLGGFPGPAEAETIEPARDIQAIQRPTGEDKLFYKDTGEAVFPETPAGEATDKAIGATPEDLETIGEPESTFKTIDDVLMFSKHPVGKYKDLNKIKLTADTGTKKITHTAGYWINAIDDRIKAVNEMRGCA